METGRFEVTDEGGTAIHLAMQRLWLTGQILPVGARLMVRHTFQNSEQNRNSEVIYSFMLPRDAALRRFEVDGDGFTAHSELRRVQEAVKAYEEGIEAGRLSTLARAYRDGVVNLSLGNIRPGEQVAVTLEVMAGVELRDDGFRFRFPFTLAPGYHPLAKMMLVEGYGEIELPPDDFGDVILPKYSTTSEGLHEVGFDIALRTPGTPTLIGSPSHAIQVREGSGVRRVTPATSSDLPDRDLVLDVRGEPDTQVLTSRGRFAIVVPSIKFGASEGAPRRVALVIDRSGSMRGRPMDQARRAVEACLGALGPDDQFGLVAFDNVIESMDRRLARADAQSRTLAADFLKKIDARGGTELAAGFSAGAQLANGGDVLVITDGQVMGTEDILAAARAQNVRIHCLGIGSASQDRFLAQLASATGGISRFVTPQERVDVAAVDLFASIGRPVAGEVSLDGAVCDIEPSHSVFAGSPWVAFGEAPEGQALTVRYTRGAISIPAAEDQPDVHDTLKLLAGARRISDLESRWTAEAAAEIEPKLVALSEQYGLASRAMALVAVVERPCDSAGAPPLTRVVPVGMPQGTRASAYFRDVPRGGRPAAGAVNARAIYSAYSAAPGSAGAPMPLPASASPQSLAEPDAAQRGDGTYDDIVASLIRPSADAAPRSKRGFFWGGDRSNVKPAGIVAEGPAAEQPAARDATDRLLEIAASLAPDGGMPGGSGDHRALATAAAVLFFLSEGHTPVSGAFRAHVERMVRFLEAITGLAAPHQSIVTRVAAFARAEKRPKVAEPKTWPAIEGSIE
ncbi:MAG: VIT domain-containing protein [Capsulimonadaceae bacterium]